MVTLVLNAKIDFAKDEPASIEPEVETPSEIGVIPGSGFPSFTIIAQDTAYCDLTGEVWLENPVYYPTGYNYCEHVVPFDCTIVRWVVRATTYIPPTLDPLWIAPTTTKVRICVNGTPNDDSLVTFTPNDKNTQQVVELSIALVAGDRVALVWNFVDPDTGAPLPGSPTTPYINPHSLVWSIAYEVA